MDTGLGIREKVTLVFTVFAGLLVLGVGLFAYSSARDALETAILSELESVAIEKETAVENWVGDRLNEIIALSRLPGLQNYLQVLRTGGTDAELQAAIRNLELALSTSTGGDQPFGSIFLIDPESGEVIAASDSAEDGKIKLDQPYFSGGLQGPYLQSLYYSIALQQPAMTVSAPVLGPDGDLLAVIAGRLDLAELQELIRPAAANRQTIDAYIVTQSNLFATQPRYLEDPAVLQREIRTDAVETCVAGQTGTTEGLDYRGVWVISAHRWLATENLCLLVELDRNEAFNGTRALAQNILIFGGAALVAATFLAVALARTITRPVLRLHEATQQLIAGNWKHRVAHGGTDELGLLAENFNRMSDILEKQDADLRGQAGRLTEMNRQLESFSYSVSHDLRAPLRSIDGFSRMLAEDYGDKLDDNGKRYIHIVRGAAQKMGKLIDDLLTFSRVGREELQMRSVAVERLAREVVGESSALEARNIEFKIGSLPKSRADLNMIRQVLQNLIGNAVKYTRECDPARIEIGSLPAEGEAVYFIRDNGTGFDMKYVDKLFGVFQRLHRAEEYDGTGVGLAIVKQIVERHGGRVWAEGVLGSGATFYFTLPLDDRSGEKRVVHEDEVSLAERASDLV